MKYVLSEHVDYGIKVDWDSGQKIIYRGNEPMANANYPEYMKAIQAMKESMVIKSRSKPV